ncbi:hypothetical protein GCM10009017_15590 [Halarchaeum rubridurum]|nr:hypothetical protein GCM10009017_15590 [Halarchaeum rubridurum]
MRTWVPGDASTLLDIGVGAGSLSTPFHPRFEVSAEPNRIVGIGRSRRAQRYGIASREEAAAYLAHETLGPRLRECTRIVNGLTGRSANDIFGSPDDLTFRSSMTLFDAVGDDPEPFETALEQYYDGEPDPKTLELLSEP